MPLEPPADGRLEAGLRTWLPRQRWFSGKDRVVSDVRVLQRIPLLAEEEATAEHVLVGVEFDNGEFRRYQVPLGYRERLPEPLAVWALPDKLGYDGLQDPAVAARYLDALASQQSIGPLGFVTVPGAWIDATATGRVLGAEQSNTSVVFGNSLLFKIFRQFEAGLNPDVELHRALGGVGCEYVAALQGWLESDVDGEATTLAMAQEFVPSAGDGWENALESVRGALAGNAPADDFVSESQSLGVAVAHVHADLARSLGSSERPLDATIDDMRARLDRTASAVPQIAQYREAVADVFDEAAGAGVTTVHRVHGDLHLGQVLRTPSRWLLIDFEGEPVKTLAERRRPDSPLRDVAGMLRSFDYAGNHLLADAVDASDEVRERAAEWTTRSTAAFCAGYASVSGADPREQSALLRAYELDKAIYEARYEAGNRPTWLPLPLRAIARLVA